MAGLPPGSPAEPLTVAADTSRRLSALDIAMMVAGIVIGAGIFRAPADVARLAGDLPAFLGLWLLGGAIAILGGVTYAGMARSMAGIGGEYRFLAEGWGRVIAGLFVWARMAVIQTGALATVAFVAGAYLATLLPGGELGWALASVALVTLFNLAGLSVSAGTQRLVSLAIILALAALVVAGLALPSGSLAPAAGETPAGDRNLGLALVFVMLVYGGWNEAASLSGETRGGERTLRRGLLGGILLVALLYVAVNLSYIAALGLDGLTATPAPAARIAEAAFGPAGSAVVALVVALAAFSTLNVTTLTGARAMCALGRDLPALAALGRWDAARAVPVVSLLVQGAVALGLVGLGGLARDGFEAMVAFTAPVFWLFLVLVALVPFRVAGLGRLRLPAIPFAAAGLWMLWSSIGYARVLAGQSELAGWLGLGGLALVVAGLPLVLKKAAARSAGSGPARP
ncbi:MAG: APC family permease [Thermaurantiacus tibetensis]